MTKQLVTYLCLTSCISCKELESCTSPYLTPSNWLCKAVFSIDSTDAFFLEYRLLYSSTFSNWSGRCNKFATCLMAEALASFSRASTFIASAEADTKFCSERNNRSAFFRFFPSREKNLLRDMVEKSLNALLTEHRWSSVLIESSFAPDAKRNVKGKLKSHALTHAGRL